MGSYDPGPIRDGLMAAVARGRKRMSHAVVTPVVDRVRSPIAPGLSVYDCELCSEPDSPQGWVPMRLVWKQAGGETVLHVTDNSAAEDTAAQAETREASTQLTTDTGITQSTSGSKLMPAVIFLHSTGKHMDMVRPYQEEYAKAGYFTAAIDCRYHGERCVPVPGQAPRDVYQDALVRAWREGPERPFLLDNVWDLLHVVDYLASRPEVDPARIGITGVSLGGMHAWLAAALDERIAVAAPMIGVQGFKWALDHRQFQGRVDSIPKVFAAAAEDLGKPTVDAEVVRAVWDRITPGLLDTYDAPLSLPAIAPRPLLIANGGKDPRCPVPGVEAAVAAAREVYMQFFLPPAPEPGEGADQQGLSQEPSAAQAAASDQAAGQPTGLGSEQPGRVGVAGQQQKEDTASTARHASEEQVEQGAERLLSQVPSSSDRSQQGAAAAIATATATATGTSTPWDGQAASVMTEGQEGDMITAAFEEAAAKAAAERAVYEAAVQAVNERLVLYLEPGAGHEQTAGMNRAIRAFFDLHLRHVQRPFSSVTVQRNIKAADH